MFSMRFVKNSLVNKSVLSISRRTLVNNITSNYVVTSGRSDIEIPNITLQEYFTDKHCKFENYVAIECAETKRKYTYGEIRDKSSSLSKSLKNILKLEAGDVVAIILRNIPEYQVAYLGILKANLVTASVSTALTPEEISRQITDSGAKAIITEVELHTTVTSALKISKKNIPILVVKHHKEDSIPEHAINFHEFVNAKADYPEIPPCDPNAVALLPYSSGTTGLPKGVELTHRNLVANSLQNYVCDSEYQDDATDSFQELVPNILPLYHIFGHAMICGTTVFGAKMVNLPKFTQEQFIAVLRDFKSTLMYLVPPLVLMLTYHEGVKKEYLQHVKSITSGGAPLSSSDEQQLIQKFGKDVLLLQGYGLTETSPTATSLYPKLLENEDSYKGSIGRPLPNTLIKIINPDDPENRPQGPNVTGELFIKGPQVTRGYRNLPEETEKLLTDDGWLRSGDLGHYNNDGFLFITDRLKELIKVKGNQVPPAELEGVIRSFPGVTDAAVIGIPHATSGEVPRAYIVAEKGLDIEKLNEFVSSKVARYKQLKGGIQVVDAIPKNASGKILRREIREMYAKGK